MQLKFITPIAVLLLVVASLSISGCTSNTNNAKQTPSANSSVTSSAAPQHDAFLENYLAQYKKVAFSDANKSFKVWELTWVNGTSARLEWTAFNKTLNATYSYVETFVVFPTTQDATNSLNAMNKTGYSLASTRYPGNGTYQRATGHAPQLYKLYVWNAGTTSNISEYKYRQIQQLDNITIITRGKQLS